MWGEFEIKTFQIFDLNTEEVGAENNFKYTRQW